MFATANQSLEARTLSRDLKMSPRSTQSGRVRKRRRNKTANPKVNKKARPNTRTDRPTDRQKRDVESRARD